MIVPAAAFAGDAEQASSAQSRLAIAMPDDAETEIEPSAPATTDTTGAVAPVNSPQISFPDARPRSLSFVHLHTREKLHAEYWANGDYVPGALGAINHLLRDFRNGETHVIEPKLLDLLALLHMKLESRNPFQVLSGYRAAATNAMLYTTTAGVNATSLHMEGQAIDIFLPGCELTTLRDAARALNIGGVGYYSGRFVHVDVGPVKWW
jgi:uncharacterized protein YcbK (DUF882 family)